ncbi:MAG: HAD-IIB family hydrolase [bacterium]|nr:HAD-IIB family hydrolase [bacterium]
MKDIKEMTWDDIRDVKMIVFDVDGVIVPRGTIISQNGPITTIGIKKVPSYMIKLITDLHNLGYHVNISSGRSLCMLMDMFRPILSKVSITYENGSATWMAGKIQQHHNSFTLLNVVHEKLAKIKSKLIKGFEQKNHIITIHCEERVAEIEEVVKSINDACSKAHYDCIWNGEAYDIQIQGRQNKGRGVREVGAMLFFQGLSQYSLGIGDNYNDKELLERCDISVTADASRLKGDFSIELSDEVLPGFVLAQKILSLHPGNLQNQ